MTYAEYLKSQGATEDDVKVLDTPIGRKAFDSMQADAETRVSNYKAEADRWYNETILPNYQKMEQEATAAKANEARAKALILASQDDGLKKVAADMGYRPDGAASTTPTTTPNTIDTSKFVTVERLNQLSNDVGAGLAALQDMVIEHSQLFPDKRLDVRAIRAEAMAANKNVYDYWQQKYSVPAARDARAAAEKAAYDANLIKQGHDAAVSELASQYANPNTVPASSSSNAFAPRPKVGREKMPWEAGLDAENGSGDRVSRAAKNFVERQNSGQGYGRTN